MWLIILFIASIVAGMIIAPLCKPDYVNLKLILGARHSHEQRRAGRRLLHDDEEPEYIYDTKPKRRTEKPPEKTFKKR